MSAMMRMTLRQKLQKEILLLDGAFGTYIQSLGLEKKDFKGKEGCMEYLSIASPGIIQRLHEDYLAAGADAIETNTFGGSSLKLAEYGLSDDVFEINKVSTQIARQAADKFSSDGRPRYVVGTMGPTGKLPSSTDPVLGDISYDKLKDIYREQASAILAGGADAILIETGQDILEIKAAINGSHEAALEHGSDPVIIAQCTLSENGRMLLGTDISAVSAIFSGLKVDVIGLNCGAGPLEMEEEIRYLSEHCGKMISYVPNAGLPVEKDGKTVFPMSPEEMGKIMARFSGKYRINVIGGCCGTTPRHIGAIRKNIGQHPRVRNRKVLTDKKKHIFCASAYKGFDLSVISRPIKVAERLNSQGSREMKQMLIDENYDRIVELGKEQEERGALAVDLCCALTERDTEKRDETMLVKRLSESLTIPLMIDSIDTDVISSALSAYPGTAFINSANLEKGVEKAGKIFALAKEHGSFVVCLTIDAGGMAISTSHKMKVVGELYDMATRVYGLDPGQLVFDMLTFSLGTGDEKYADSAVNTLNAIKTLKKDYPGTSAILGVSNVSFGLQPAGRRILNASFLHHAARAGLDMAIMNPRHMIEYSSIPRSERRLAEALIYNRSKEALSGFIEYFSHKTVEKRPIIIPAADKELSVKDKLERCVIERNKADIMPLLDEALEQYAPEDIINGILLEAMKKVGEKLESGEFVLPYVLQAAEVMRKAMDHLGDKLGDRDSHIKGKVLLATVFGDVHDIGKNLVKMILDNNGYQVIDLGKQVPAEKIADEAVKNKVDAVGLSALLVSTARYMAECVQALSDSGVECPVIIGGSPTNENFAEEISILRDQSVYKGKVHYARDAFAALKILDMIKRDGKVDPSGGKAKVSAVLTDKSIPSGSSKKNDLKLRENVCGPVPAPPFYGVRVVPDIPVDEIFSRVNKNMLFNVAWGAGLKDVDKKKELIDMEYEPMLQELKKESLLEGWAGLKAVYGFFRCRMDGTDMEVLDASGNVMETIDLSGGLAEYFLPEDVVAFFAATAGKKVGEKIADLDRKHEYSKTFFLHGLSTCLAEAAAEYMHEIIRKEFNIAEGQGKRYSPGYPMWRDLSDQKKIFHILDVEKSIDVKLTKAFQMVPEQSVTAMVVHNRSAEY